MCIYPGMSPLLGLGCAAALAWELYLEMANTELSSCSCVPRNTTTTIIYQHLPSTLCFRLHHSHAQLRQAQVTKGNRVGERVVLAFLRGNDVSVRAGGNVACLAPSRDTMGRWPLARKTLFPEYSISKSCDRGPLLS